MKLTYGAELELADVNTDIVLPVGNRWDYKDYTIRNSDGTWNDPLKTIVPYGGEINTLITDTIPAALININEIYRSVGMKPAYINSTTNLHIHIGIPDWNASTVKRLVDYVWRYQRELFAFTPLPKDLKFRRRSVSNQGTIPTYIRNRILAGDIDFGSTRFGINIKSLYLHGTVEFRQFHMTTKISELRACFEFCETIVRHALDELGMVPGPGQLPTYTRQIKKLDMLNHFGRSERIDILRRVGPINISFYCFGNVNRSKAAEIVFKALDTENLFKVYSYGTRVGTYGKPIHSQTAKCLRDAGYTVPATYSTNEVYAGLYYSMVDGIEDPGYTADGHYNAFIAVEARCKQIYKEITGEEPKTRFR